MAEVRYINPTGNNGNDGSKGSPWQTPVYAATNSPSGTTIYMQYGNDGIYDGASLGQFFLTDTQIGEINQFDLLRAALRQRPDIIIVGETRGREAYTLFQAMATGHGGFSSIHADSVDATLTRLTSSPMDVPKALISNSLDLITLQLKIRIGDKSARRIIQVSEINGIESNTDDSWQ